MILRRVDDSFCDPLELRSDSYLGVAGLLDAVRAGSVTVCNALGSGLMETSSFGPFLPGLSRRLLGEELALPSVATWWCGQPKAMHYVEENLKFLVIKPASPSTGMEPVFGGKLSTGEQAKLLAKIQAKPREFVGQELIDISSVPVWSGEALVPRRVVLRVYMAAAGDSWIVMPGGLARVSPAPDAPVVSMQRGGGSKDVWVLSEKPVDNFTLRRPSSQPVELNRGISADLPSRAVDHLFWFGRYAERCEHLCRVLRCILLRVTGETGASGTLNWTSLMTLYASLDSPHSRLAKDDPQGHLDLPRELEQEVLSLIFEEQRSDSLSANLNRTVRAAAQVRDRLSADMLRAISRLGSAARSSDGPAWGYASTADALAVLNRCVGTLAALRGLEMENMTRGPGWRFLSIGRRIERSVQLVDLFRAIVVPMHPEAWPLLEMLLEVADSSMTYRSRYFTALQTTPVLDLLMNDAANPRSLAFQIDDLIEHCAGLAAMPLGAGWPVQEQKHVEEVATILFNTDVRTLCRPNTKNIRAPLDAFLASLGAALPEFSDAISNTYFSHAQMGRAS